MFFARGLAPCSNYTLHIVPQFGDFSFEAISAKASTHLGDCQEDLLEDDIEEISSSTQTTLVNDIQLGHNFETKRRSPSTSSPVLFLGKPIVSLSFILLLCFSWIYLMCNFFYILGVGFPYNVYISLIKYTWVTTGLE